MADFFSSYWNLFPVSFAQSLLYAFVALGVMIPFRLLNFPDLSCEGSFPLGGCLCAALIAAKLPPGVAMLIAVVAGYVAGCATAAIHLRLRINTLLAGILVITMLWSLDLRIMGKSNVPLFSLPNVFDTWWPQFTQNVLAQIVFWLALSVAAVLLLQWFLRTELGLVVRAVGANDTMARANGVNVDRVMLFGVGAANAVVAFAGAAVAQIQGYADVAMGFGMLISGLAALIIGEAIAGRDTVLRQILAPFVGSAAYYQVIALGLAAGVHPSDLKMVTALFVLVMLVAWGLSRIFSGRAVYVYIGSILGTVMIGNVWFRMLPALRDRAAANESGRAHDAAAWKQALLRSEHNSYLAFPVVTLMLSIHHPSVSGGAFNIAVLALLLAGFVAARHVVVKGRGRQRALAAVVVALAGMILLTGSTPARVATGTGAPVAFAAVQAVINQRCIACHSSAPADRSFGIAPGGMSFDAPDDIRRFAPRMRQRIVLAESMPFANHPKPSAQERELLGRWVDQGAVLQ